MHQPRMGRPALLHAASMGHGVVRVEPVHPIRELVPGHPEPVDLVGSVAVLDR